MPVSNPDPATPSRPTGLMKIKATLWNREVVTYLIFGVLTTALNYGVYFALRQLISWPLANVIAWLVAVEFAFVTNRALVFRSRGHYFTEMAQFYLSRLATLGLESLTLWILLDGLHAPEWFAKLFANFLVVIGNYVLSKLLVFRRQHQDRHRDPPPQEAGD